MERSIPMMPDTRFDNDDDDDEISYNEQSPLCSSLDIIATTDCTSYCTSTSNSHEAVVNRNVRSAHQPRNYLPCNQRNHSHLCHHLQEDGLRCCCGEEETYKPEVYESFRTLLGESFVDAEKNLYFKIRIMFVMATLAVLTVIALAYLAIKLSKPPRLPVGPYILLERHEGEHFFDFYNFFQGADSAGSHGYNQYVNRKTAFNLNIANVTWEKDAVNFFGRKQNKKGHKKGDAFVYMSSAPTKQGPRDSIRLESIRAFDRGLFIIDVRHVPTGCGVWPAFWLTDTLAWPKNGEIDVIEAVNYQSDAKAALHSTQGCHMENAPLGTMTGAWDFAEGVPERYTGLPDMTKRPARDCFVYAPHQWLNQGCAVTNIDGGTIGAPLNHKGGGVYVLEMDPINRHVRSWVFTPHDVVPENLQAALGTLHLSSEHQIAPNPEEWPLPYAYFPIGAGTDCPSDHFQHLKIVFNTAFCGSAAGDRFYVDCRKQAKLFDTCHDWIKSEPQELLLEAYWKIRGVYIYERSWEDKKWIM